MENITVIQANTEFEILDAARGHPNRIPFKGVLTYFDVPSDAPVGGARGKRVLIPTEVGLAALDTLIGTPLNSSQKLDRHDEREIIGTIESASIGEALPNGAVPVIVEGVLFGANKPKEVERIQSESRSSKMGFSYEARAKGVVEGGVLRVSEVMFTGATALFRDKAAYKTTSLAASKQKRGDYRMSENSITLAQIQALVAHAAQSDDDGSTGEVIGRIRNMLVKTENATLSASVAEMNGKLEAMAKTVTELANVVLELQKNSISASSDIVPKADFDNLKSQVESLTSHSRKSVVPLKAGEPSGDAKEMTEESLKAEIDRIHGDDKLHVHQKLGRIMELRRKFNQGRN